MMEYKVTVASVYVGCTKRVGVLGRPHPCFIPVTELRVGDIFITVGDEGNQYWKVVGNG